MTEGADDQTSLRWSQTRGRYHNLAALAKAAEKRRTMHAGGKRGEILIIELIGNTDKSDTVNRKRMFDTTVTSPQSADQDVGLQSVVSQLHEGSESILALHQNRSRVDA